MCENVWKFTYTLSTLHSLVAKLNINLAKYVSTEGIDWNFLPPRASNFGRI